MQKLVRILLNNEQFLPSTCFDEEKKLIVTLENMNRITQTCRIEEVISAAKKIRLIIEMKRNTTKLHGKIGQLTNELKEAKEQEIPTEPKDIEFSIASLVQYTRKDKNNCGRADIQALIDSLTEEMKLGAELKKECYEDHYPIPYIVRKETDEETKERSERSADSIRNRIKSTEKAITYVNNEIEKNEKKIAKLCE